MFGHARTYGTVSQGSSGLGIDQRNQLLNLVRPVHSNFPELESGRAYRFKVRAVNYCSAVDTWSICYGYFSESTAYTVR